VLSFIPRDTRGHLNAGSTVVAGEFDGLAAALGAAAEKYGPADDARGEAGEGLLRRPDVAYHYSPLVEGERQARPDRGRGRRSVDEKRPPVK
jgi:hypothetical protein